MTETTAGKTLAAYMPVGSFNLEPGSNTSDLLEALGLELDILKAHARGLVLEANPLTMNNMLPIRYNEAGLPNRCRGVPATFEEQRAEVIGKWSSRGGASLQYFRDLAKDYGFRVLINEYPIWHMDVTSCETQGVDDSFNTCWQVHYIDNNSRFARADESVADDYLEYIQNPGVACILNFFKPAHTTIVYTPWSTYLDMIYRPTLDINFAGIDTLPTGFTFTRTGTATRINPYGLIETVPANQPRFDWNSDGTYCKGLLIEETRTNILLNSLINGTNLSTQSVTVTAQTYTLSFYGDGSITCSGTSTRVTTGIGAYPNRTTVTFTPTGGTLTLTVSGIVKFAQLEAGSFATSFIPTDGTVKVRGGETCSVTDPYMAWYKQSEGTIKLIGFKNSTSNGSWFSLQNGMNDSISAKFTGANIETQIKVGGTLQSNASMTFTTNAPHRFVMSYKLNNFDSCIDGGITHGGYLGTVPAINTLSIGDGDAPWNGHITKFTYYPHQITGQDFVDLTVHSTS